VVNDIGLTTCDHVTAVCRLAYYQQICEYRPIKRKHNSVNKVVGDKNLKMYRAHTGTLRFETVNYVGCKAQLFNN